MIKVVALFRKKEGLSTEAFRAYYENRHVKLFARVLEMPGVERYVRRYLTPLKDAISGKTPSSGFDVIMEIWFSSRETFEAYYGAPLDLDFLERVAVDEENLFDRSQMFLHTVEEFDSDIPNRHVDTPLASDGNGADVPLHGARSDQAVF